MNKAKNEKDMQELPEFRVDEIYFKKKPGHIMAGMLTKFVKRIFFFVNYSFIDFLIFCFIEVQYKREKNYFWVHLKWVNLYQSKFKQFKDIEDHVGLLELVNPRHYQLAIQI